MDFYAQMTARAPIRNAFLVLGMHRSGTSAFAGTLARLGLSLPAELMAPDPANANGYFESWELAGLHNAMLRAAASGWDDWSPISDEWFGRAAATNYARPITVFLEREFADATNFVIKDPRICRVVPVWRDALTRFGAKLRVVLPLRHPAAVAQSLMTRNGFLPSESYLLWLRHTLDAERATRDLPRAFVAFDELLDDWRSAVTAIAARLAITWPRSLADAAPEIEVFLEPRLRHHLPRHSCPDVADRTSQLAFEAWEEFGALSRGTAAPDTISRLDALREELDRIPSAYRLPLGFGAIAGPAMRLVSRLRLRRIYASDNPRPLPSAEGSK
jgi:hypothetical protein